MTHSSTSSPSPPPPPPLPSSTPLWTVRTTLEWTQNHLATKGVQNPRLEAQWLLCAATGLTRLELFTNYDLPLDPAQRATLRNAIQRRAADEPLQYILGKAAFRHLELTVRPGVLIPRPETEVLVDLVLVHLKKRAEGVRVLDLCTGTGCIALALLNECPTAQVTATDIDPSAVELAWENACELNLDGGDRLSFLADDLASSLVANAVNHETFDAVVSNPPYIPSAELASLPNEIAQYEPRLALDGGRDGLDIFRRILEEAMLLLVSGGMLACELHETRLGEARLLCERSGYIDIAIHSDLTERPRIITAIKPAKNPDV